MKVKEIIGISVGAGVAVILLAGVIFSRNTVRRAIRHISIDSVAKLPDARKIGLLGAARIAPAAITSPASKMKEVIAYGVAARDKKKAAKFAKDNKIGVVYDKYEDVLADQSISIVYIGLVNSHHYDWIIKSLKAGKHVLCEKPITANSEEARTIKEIADQSGLLLMEAFHYKHHPAFIRILELLKSGEIGTVRQIIVKLYVPWLFYGQNDPRFMYGFLILNFCAY
eukprot:TRINITY_DN5003_c0_g1_i2.p1 TRINITY_DN5003_c0_g1~~TRINITY_DN5003_c0_g1_i2.p1  ORF type:complete len:226 (+),score=50.51 TRINITY_DN5003_c0_g1_i2:23-700(+)